MQLMSLTVCLGLGRRHRGEDGGSEAWPPVHSDLYQRHHWQPQGSPYLIELLLCCCYPLILMLLSIGLYLIEMLL